MTALDAALPRNNVKTAIPGKLPLRELTERWLLLQIAPVGVLVNNKGDILYLHGRAGQYLEPAQGEAGINNILKMAREGLRHELITALHKSVGSKEISHCPGLRVRTNGEFTIVNLTILPIATGGTSAAHEPSLYLVILEQVRPSGLDPLQHSSLEPEYPALDADDRIASLMQELKTKEEYLQASNEELETSNEELNPTTIIVDLTPLSTFFFCVKYRLCGFSVESL